MLSYILAGTLFLSLFKKKQKNFAIASSSSSGIVFNCNSIKLIDKTKFHDFIRSKLDTSFKNRGINIIQFYKTDTNVIFLKIFEDINKNCYFKFVKRNLNSREKIVLLLLFSEIIEVFKEQVNLQAFYNGIHPEDPVLTSMMNQKLYEFSNYLTNWMNAKKEIKDLPKILDKFQTRYSYP